MAAPKIDKVDPAALYVAVQSFVCADPKGGNLTVRGGETLRGANAAVQAKPALFLPAGLSDDERRAELVRRFPDSHMYLPKV
jgi:hypothetical protein